MYQEKLTFQEILQNDVDIDAQNILSDFDSLDFSNGPFNPSDEINYNEGKEANPFDKIAKYYGRNKNVFLFISMLSDKEQSKKIIDIISKKCDIQAKEKFIKRMEIYLERINKGEHDAKEFLNSDLVAFFHGYHVPCPGHNRNIHENLNINITKPGQSFESSSFFHTTIKSIDEEQSDVKRAKIYSNGRRIVTILKNEKLHRNYSFAKPAICNIEISWSVIDESGKEINCVIDLNINAGQFTMKNSNIEGITVAPQEILEFAKQNEVVLISGKTLHEVLAEHLIE